MNVNQNGFSGPRVKCIKRVKMAIFESERGLKGGSSSSKLFLPGVEKLFEAS